MREKIGLITLNEGVNLGYALGLLGHLSDYFEIVEVGVVCETATSEPARPAGLLSEQPGYDDYALGLNPLDDF